MSLVLCKDLAVGYGADVVADGISCTVEPGQMMCVVGENGAGKSTFLKTLLGLMPALGGTLEFGDGLVRTELGYLPQRDESQRDFPASVFEVVISGCLSSLGKRPFYGKAEKEKARSALERAGALNLAERPFGKLSGGQQQRVLLARALCAASKLLVLDEPTTGLDPKAACDLYSTVDELRAQGMGVIAVVHDVDHAIEHASHVLQFGDGSCWYGTSSDFRASRMEAHHA